MVQTKPKLEKHVAMTTTMTMNPKVDGIVWRHWQTGRHYTCIIIVIIIIVYDDWL